MIVSDTLRMIGVFTIALLTAEFGQVWAEQVCRDVTPQLRLSAYDFVNPGFTKSHTSLDNIVSLENRITYEIVYDFRGDRTTVQLCSCRQRIWVRLEKARIKESHTTLGEIVGLHNCAVADITPQLRSNAKRKDDHL